MKLRSVLTILLAALLVLGLCACTGGTDNAEPTPSPTPDPSQESLIFTVRFDEVPFYTAPLTGVEYTAGTVNTGDEVKFVAFEGDYVKVEMELGQYWIHSWYLQAKDPIMERQKVVSFVESRMNSDTFEVIEGNPVYTCMAGLLNCRSLPSTKGVILTQLEFGDEVKVIGKDKDFYLVYLPDGNAVYAVARYLEEQATYVDLEGAVDLRVYMPGAEFDMLFASEENVVGEAMYPAIPLLEESTAKMLMEAYKIFREDGYTIKIYDAYRPKSAQYKLYDIVQNANFIANPYNGDSWHQSGRAVDISLVNMYTGKELEMPTPMHTFNMDAARTSSEKWTPNARANVAYMTSVMTEVGFTTISTEWWHFQNSGSGGGKLNNELDWEALTYVPVSQYVATTEIINPQPGPGDEVQEGAE